MITELRIAFRIGEEESKSLKYIGLGINQDEDTITIYQESCRLVTRLKNGTVKDLLEVNKVIRQLKSNHLQLKYCKLGTDDDCYIY